VMMDRDSKTRAGARAPGAERSGPLARRCLTRASSLTPSREYTVKAVGTKDEGKPGFGKALSDIPALKPYRGKLAVRNFRGGDGNVGIIRSPVRAIALPDNRHGVEDEKALRVRTSDPLGLESCVATARNATKRRQRIGGVGIQLRKDHSGRQPFKYARLATRTGAIARVSARSGVVEDPRHTYKLHAREPGDLGDTCRQTRQQVGGRRR
jgi:hypothetical protein